MADEINPYAPPAESQPAVEFADPGDQLAGRFTRLAAAIADGLIVGAIVLPVQLLSGTFQRSLSQEVGPLEQLLLSLLGIVAMLAINGYPLLNRGQTVGKMLTNIQIVDADSDKLLPFVRVYVYRYLWTLPLVFVVMLIPGAMDNALISVITLIDSLLIFTASRRCLHDHIAGSRVVIYKPNRQFVS